MCTLTFVPKSINDFIITSNRDEDPARATISPARYEKDGVQLLYPKDALAGGTWIGVSTQNRFICLLNGGFTIHKRADSYRMSRGVIVTKLLTAPNFKEAIKNFNFNEIEPFTIIIVEWEKTAAIFELVWDGTQSHFKEKSWAPHIWSSSLLYTSESKKLREQWFSDFLLSTLQPNAAEILDFHKTAGQKYTENALVMDRQFVKTKSITQVKKEVETIHMRYEDLQANVLTNTTI